MELSEEQKKFIDENANKIKNLIELDKRIKDIDVIEKSLGILLIWSPCDIHTLNLFCLISLNIRD